MQRTSSPTMRVALLLLWVAALCECSFAFQPTRIPQKRRTAFYRTTQHRFASSTTEPLDDATLLADVPRQQFVDLCQQLHLSTKGSKAELLQRLRQHANTQAELERQRILDRKQRVEEASDPKERHEIVGDDSLEDDDKEEEGFFYFYDPSITINTTLADLEAQERRAKRAKQPPVPTVPLPPTEPNENGERVVTVYDTRHHNDLTGIAATQPGQNNLDNLNAVAGATGQQQPWDASSLQSSKTTNHELEQAREDVTELVTTLLALSGAPAYRNLVDDEDDDTLDVYNDGLSFEGFNPAKVPTDLLTRSSNAIRAGRGQVLQDVLREFELKAVGYDGMHGDDVEKGGGHYREVVKVRAFLEGYRRAEIRRLARETTTLLLEKLIMEGIEGLDMTLRTMMRSSDDTGDMGGILNDSLIDFLNDAIRQQETKVKQEASSLLDAERQRLEASSLRNDTDTNMFEDLWNVTMEDGDRVESIDPNDPKVKQVLQEELERAKLQPTASVSLPAGTPQKILLLLKLLRDRVKAEAAFAPDEKGRNLRLLAYCLRLDDEDEIAPLVLKEFGNSLDRLDSFLELVASSIEYGESTSYEMKPGRSGIFNVSRLRKIQEIIKGLRDKQTWKASGLIP